MNKKSGQKAKSQHSKQRDEEWKTENNSKDITEKETGKSGHANDVGDSRISALSVATARSADQDLQKDANVRHTHSHAHREMSSGGARRKTVHTRKKRDTSSEKRKLKLPWSSFKIKGKFSGNMRDSQRNLGSMSDISISSSSGMPGCICTGYRKREEHVAPSRPMSQTVDGPPKQASARSSNSNGHTTSNMTSFKPNTSVQSQTNRAPCKDNDQSAPPAKVKVPYVAIDLNKFDPSLYPTEDPDQIAWEARQIEMEEGVEVKRSRAAQEEFNATFSRQISINDLINTCVERKISRLSHDQQSVATSSRSAAATEAQRNPQEMLPILPILPPAPHEPQSGGYPLLSSVSGNGSRSQNERAETSLSNHSDCTQNDYEDHNKSVNVSSLAASASSALVSAESESGSGSHIWESGSSRPVSVAHAHTQIDYVHCLVPDLQQIHNSGFYWGVMDRYGAEKYLENKPEGTFLLRDSAQEEFLFSVSFRRYGRTLHARIEQWNHKFSFDSHDPGVFASDTVCGLIEHYKDPSCCMFFEPMLTIPLNRNNPFDLRQLCRSVICTNTYYDGITHLPLPARLKEYLKYYHYKQKVRVRRLDQQV